MRWRRRNPIPVSLALLAAFTLAASSASAATIQYPYSFFVAVDDAGPTTSVELQVPTFDASLGTLELVEFGYAWTGEASALVPREAGASPPSVFLEIGFSLSVADLEIFSTAPLPLGDAGCLPFDSAFWSCSEGNSRFGQVSITDDLAPFLGDGSLTPMLWTVMPRLYVDGELTDADRILGSTGYQSVLFTYAPIPEPTGALVFAVGAGLVAARLRRRA